MKIVIVQNSRARLKFVQLFLDVFRNRRCVFFQKILYQRFHKIVCKNNFNERLRKIKNKKKFRREKKMFRYLIRWEKNYFRITNKLNFFFWKTLTKRWRRSNVNVSKIICHFYKKKTIVKTKFKKIKFTT